MAPSASAETSSVQRGGATTIAIVGAGQAGAQAACTLREQGFEGRVLLFGDETHPPYQRPPLSKAFLERALSIERLHLRPSSFYAANRIELRLGSPVEAIDRRAGRLRLRGQGSVPYDKLLLATGCRPRTLRLPGSQHSDVHYLRSVQDALRLRAKIQAGRRITIVGGGYIGLEVAAIARAAGAEVTVIEKEDRLLKRVTSHAISDFFAHAHRARGVSVECAVQVTQFVGAERLEAVLCEHGRIESDIVLVGIGAEPNIELARDAGLTCEDGIVVDEHCRTSEPEIFAAGDCTNHWNAALGRHLRLESVQNAASQATTAALNMLGRSCRYDEVPWFWSNQYQYKLQTAGHFLGYDEIEERGDPAAGSFALVYRKAGVLLAVDAINLPREYMSVRRELSEQRSRAVDARAHAARAAERRVA